MMKPTVLLTIELILESDGTLTWFSEERTDITRKSRYERTMCDIKDYAVKAVANFHQTQQIANLEVK